MPSPESGRTILIIENDSDYAGVLGEALTQGGLAGTKIKIVGTVQEGLDIIKSEKPNLVFLDLKLPDQPGFDLLKELQGEIPTGVITLDLRPESRTYALQLGARAFFSKATVDVTEIQDFAKAQLQEHSDDLS